MLDNKEEEALGKQKPWQKGELQMKWQVYQEKLGMKKAKNLKKLMEYVEELGRRNELICPELGTWIDLSRTGRTGWLQSQLLQEVSLHNNTSRDVLCRFPNNIIKLWYTATEGNDDVEEEEEEVEEVIASSLTSNT